MSSSEAPEEREERTSRIDSERDWVPSWKAITAAVFIGVPVREVVVRDTHGGRTQTDYQDRNVSMLSGRS